MRFFYAFVAFLVSCASVFAQANLTGTITDASGQPLPGVTVSVLENGQIKSGDITDGDGNYRISVVKGETIEFYFLGYTKVSKVYNGQSRIDVTLEEDNLFLEDAVIVGYGTQKKSSITSAVSAIKGEELLKAPATNVSQVLAGRLPGISSVQESGEPGLDQASLRIRGSVYGVSYIVDGFPVDNINDIDPADIESISVLKDGASAAVYGFSAAGGVIIITTKKGEKGDAKITYNASFGASMNANFPKFMNGEEFARYYNVAEMMDKLANGEIDSPDKYTPYFSKEVIEMITNGDPSDGWDNVNYVDLVFGTGFNQKHNVTVQGGTDKHRYFASFGLMDQQGNIDNFYYKRYNVRANLESEIAKNLDFKLGLSGVMANRHTPAFLSGGSDGDLGYEVGWFSIGRQTIQMHPYLPVKWEGYYTGSKQNNQSMLVSPLAAIYESGYKETRSAGMSANASLNYRVPFIKGLSFKASGSFDYSLSYNKNLSQPYTMMWHTKDSSGEWAWSKRTDNPHISDNVNNLGEGVTFSQQAVGQVSANFLRSFGKNNVEALLLAEARQYKGNGLSAYVKSLPFTELPELSNGIPTNSPVGGWSSASRSAGYVGRLRYDYDERYLAEFTGRYDGSYKFAGMAKNRWGFFPSASIGWRISKEPFMQNQDVVDDLKVRASVGLLGNDSVSEYMFLSSYGQSLNVVYPNGMFPSYTTTGIANTDLTWEKTLSYNVGFDLTMWDGLLGAEIDGFYNYTYDMLTYQSSGYPPSMGGYYPTWANFNAIDSKGIDILITHRNHFNLLGKPFWYDVSASLTYSSTRWIKFKDSPNIADYRRVVGTQYGSQMCWKADGLFRSEEEIDNSAWYGTRPNVGDIKYVDINGDGVIDHDDRGYFGFSNRPRLTYGLNLNFTWNGFDFNAQFTGGALFNVSLTSTYFNGYDDNTIWTQTFKEGANSPLYLVQGAYSEYNKENATYPRLTLSTTSHGGDNGVGSTFWIRDGKYIRLKTAQFGYTLPKKVTDFVGISSLRIFVEGQNLFTIDGLPDGIDPESPGVNNGYYPQQRLVMGGLTLTF